MLNTLASIFNLNEWQREGNLLYFYIYFYFYYYCIYCKSLIFYKYIRFQTFYIVIRGWHLSYVNLYIRHHFTSLVLYIGSSSMFIILKIPSSNYLFLLFVWVYADFNMFGYISAVDLSNWLSWITNQWLPISPQVTENLSCYVYWLCVG